MNSCRFESGLGHQIQTHPDVLWASGFVFFIENSNKLTIVIDANSERLFLLRENGGRNCEEIHPNTKIQYIRQGELITINPAGEEDSLKKEIRKILKGHGKDFDDGVYRLKVIDVTRRNSNKICFY